MNFRRILVHTLIVALACTLAGCGKLMEDFENEMRAKKVTTRVNDIFTGAQKGGVSAEMETAIGRWYADKKRITDTGTLHTASDGFDHWLRAKGLFRNVKSWEILGIEPVPDDGGIAVPAVVVSVKVNNRTLRMKVPDRQPIEWTR